MNNSDFPAITIRSIAASDVADRRFRRLTQWLAEDLRSLKDVRYDWTGLLSKEAERAASRIGDLMGDDEDTAVYEALEQVASDRKLFAGEGTERRNQYGVVVRAAGIEEQVVAVFEHACGKGSYADFIREMTRVFCEGGPTDWVASLYRFGVEPTSDELDAMALHEKRLDDKQPAV